MEQTLLDHEDDGFEIRVNLLKPEVRGTANKYIVYTIKGQDKNGIFEVVRRYSEFFSVREVLLKRWPGCFIPSLPQKKMVGNMDAIFIQDRRVGLQQFLISISVLKHLWYSEELQLLIRGQVIDVQKAVSIYTKINTSQIISRYQNSFKILSGKQINADIVSKITNFHTYLKKIIPIIQYYKESSLITSQTRRKFNQQSYTLLQYMLPQYQKNCLKQYLDENKEEFIFYNNKDGNFIDCQTKIKDLNASSQFEALYVGFRKQKKQAQAFLQVIKTKEEYENLKQKAKQKVKDIQTDKQKIMSGKTSISAMIKSKTKQQALKNLENEAEKAKKQQEEYIFICDISTVILGYIQIDKFKRKREKGYYELVKKLIKFEHEYARAQNELWKSILVHQLIQKLENDQ